MIVYKEFYDGETSHFVSENAEPPFRNVELEYDGEGNGGDPVCHRREDGTIYIYWPFEISEVDVLAFFANLNSVHPAEIEIVKATAADEAARWAETLDRIVRLSK